MLLLPGLDSTKEEFFHWENVFLARGMATLSLDGPGQGETGYHTVIHPDYEVGPTAMLDHLAGRGDLDLQRVGVVGVSLGGYYAPRTAAFEPRIKAVCAIGGPYDFGEFFAERPAISRETFLHHSGTDTLEAAQAVASRLSLAGVAERIAQPFLVIFGKLDRLVPYQQAERVAAEAPNARAGHVPGRQPRVQQPAVQVPPAGRGLDGGAAAWLTASARARWRGAGASRAGSWTSTGWTPCCCSGTRA